MNGPMFARVYYIDDIDNKMAKEDLLFMANSYAEAMEIVEKQYGKDLVGASIYGYEPDEVIRVANINAMLEEARSTFEV